MTAFQLLVQACRLWLGTAAPPVDLGEGQEEELRRQAFVHGLEPLLHRLTSAGHLRGVPPILADRWEEAYFQNDVHNRQILDLLHRVATRLETAGCPFAVFKGPATLARSYRESGLRTMVDVDLLCREADLPRFCRAAAEEGLFPRSDDFVYLYHLGLAHREQPIWFEVHFDLYDFLPAHRALLDELVDKAERLELDGCRFPAIPVTAAPALDVAHLVHHDFRANLKPWLDLAAGAVARSSRQGGDAWLSWVRRVALEPELALAEAVVQRLFGVWPDFGGEAFPVQRSDVERVQAELPKVGAMGRRALEGASFRPGLRAKASYLRRLLFPPRTRLEALGRSRVRYLTALARRGWRKLGEEGLARPAEPGRSIRRRVYERRKR